MLKFLLKQETLQLSPLNTCKVKTKQLHKFSTESDKSVKCPIKAVSHAVTFTSFHLTTVWYCVQEKPEVKAFDAPGHSTGPSWSAYSDHKIETQTFSCESKSVCDHDR